MAADKIDFSAKHDVFIQNPDGTVSRMDEPYYITKKIGDHTWQILSSGDYAYLLEGDNEAIAIDCGYGAGNIREYMQSLTDKPLSSVINSHDHFDHTANNAYFDRAYMGARSIPLATIPTPSFDGIDFPRDYKKIAVGEGDTFDLGGRVLEVFDLPDHAVGSIVLLDRKERLLFTGDEFMAGGKTLNGGVRSFFEKLEKIYRHREEFDLLCGGPDIFDASLLADVYGALQSVLNGNEGEKVTEKPVKDSPSVNTDEEGHIIYHRHMPHPEDQHKDGEGADMAFRRIAAYGNAAVSYDIRLKDK